MIKFTLALAIILVSIDAVMWFVLNGFWYGVACLLTNVGIAMLWRWAYE